MRLGETTDEYEDRRASMQDDVWIKGFKPGETRVRILQPTRGKDGFTTYREHYKKEAGGGFPCGEDFDLFCPAESKHGLETDKQVQDRPRRYAFNALDEKGRLNLYKAGVKLFKKLQGHEQRKGSITDADYTIVRTGEKLETDYDPERGDKYPIDEVPELYDIPEILGQKYAAALSYYHVDEKGNTLDDQAPEPEVTQEPEATATVTRIGVVKEETPDAGGFDVESNEQAFDELTTPQVREWLRHRSVEFPNAEPRPRLIKRASEWAPF